MNDRRGLPADGQMQPAIFYGTNGILPNLIFQCPAVNYAIFQCLYSNLIICCVLI